MARRLAHGLTPQQAALLRRATVRRVYLEGRELAPGRRLIVLGLALGPPGTTPTGEPKARWIEATAKGRRFARGLWGEGETR